MTDVPQDDQAASGLDEAVGNPTPTPDVPAEQPEAKAPEGEADKPAVEPDKPSDPETGKPEAPAEAEPPKPDEEPAKEQEPNPREQAQKGYAERQRLKSQTKEAVSQRLTPPTVDELEQQGYSPEDARYEALRQEVQADKYASTVADLTANLNMDASTIETEFDIFNDKSPNFDKDYADKVSREYIRDAQVEFDQSGQFVLSSRIPMYDYYKSRYDDRIAGMKHGQVSGQKAAERMLASSETPSSAAPPPPKEVDPIERGFAEVFGG